MRRRRRALRHLSYPEGRKHEERRSLPSGTDVSEPKSVARNWRHPARLRWYGDGRFDATSRYRNKYHVNFHVQVDRLANFSWFSMEHACTVTEYSRFLSGLLSWLFEGKPRERGSAR